MWVSTVSPKSNLYFVFADIDGSGFSSWPSTRIVKVTWPSSMPPGHWRASLTHKPTQIMPVNCCNGPSPNIQLYLGLAIVVDGAKHALYGKRLWTKHLNLGLLHMWLVLSLSWSNRSFHKWWVRMWIIPPPKKKRSLTYVNQNYADCQLFAWCVLFHSPVNVSPSIVFVEPLWGTLQNLMFKENWV